MKRSRCKSMITVIEMKRAPGCVVILFLALVILTGRVLTCSAASQTVDVTANGDNITISVNGTTVKFDQAPYIANGRTMVPVRFVSEALGAQVSWDNITKTVKITTDKVIELKIGSTEARIDGDSITLDAPAEIAGGRTMVPLRFVSEALGAQVLWHQGNQIASPNPVGKTLFSDNLDSGSTNWSMDDGWRLDNIDGNSVLIGSGHKWARLNGNSWDNYALKAKFKVSKGTIHINYRHSDTSEGPQRYFIGIGNSAVYLSKQRGNEFNDLARAPLELDNGWHEIEIRAYGDILNVLIDNNLVVLYKDSDSPISAGGIAFETLDDSEALIDDIAVRETLPGEIDDGTKPGNIQNTPKSGVLQRDETWSGEIHVVGQLVVPQGITLTIEPGTTVKFKHSRDYKNFAKGGLVVDGGVLKAIGSPDKPIWFTSDADKPINGDWEGIAIENSKNGNIIDHAIVEYAFIGIRFWTSSGTVSNTIVRWINAEGIYMERSNPVIESCTIYGTGYNGIAMEQFNDVVLRNNKIFNSQGTGIHGEATKALVENNIIRNSKYGITFDDFSNAVLRNNLIENISKEGTHFYFNSTGKLFSNIIRNTGTGIIAVEGNLTANNNDIYNNMKNLELGNMQNVDIQKNWWGSNNENEIKTKTDSDIEVFFSPFLSEVSMKIPELIFDYQDVRGSNLGYTPGDPNDQYPYIYADRDETRRVVKKICGKKEGFGEASFGWSLAWDGKYLWRSLHAGSGELIKIDPETGQIVANIGNPGIAQDRGIAFDGQHLWVNDFSAKKVFEVDPATGNILSSFKIPEMGSGSSGIAWDGEYLYLVSWLKHDELYKVDRKGNLIGILKLDKEGGASITFDGQYFWTTPSGKGVRKFDKQGKLVGEIYAAAFGGEAIAHDGKYLWILHRTQEQWSDPKLYKIEVINDQILK